MPRVREGRHLNVVLDKELYAHLKAFAEQHGYTVSAIARDALRKYFSIAVDPVDAGWREGFHNATRIVLETVKRALNSVTPTAPGAEEDAAEEVPEAEAP